MRAFWNILILLSLALTLGCSGKSTEEPLCDGVVCERGVCDAATGECGNAGSCLDDQQCIVGWVCRDSACIAAQPCSDDSACMRGVCSDGACVNAQICSAPDDCIEGFRCNPASQCVEDLCATVDCERGVCNPSSRTCVNPDVCASDTQENDCLEGYFCYGQSCELPEQICDDLACSRGVCDPTTATCVQPEMCTSDGECLEGHYCDAGDCLVNQCDEQMRDCARGVCDPVDARCNNAETCREPDECIDGYSCVQGECLPLGEECVGGCPGNQACVYIAENLEAVCQEQDTCYSALDCTGERVCRDNQCASGLPCEADDLEPNDADADAVALGQFPGNVASATICTNDVDVFSYDTNDASIFRGTLVVQAAVDAVDVSLGDLELEVERPDGTIETTTSDADGVARIEINVGVLDAGVHLIRVRDGGVGVPGVGYSVYAGLLDDPTLDTCASPTLLGSSPSAGDTLGASSYLLSASCDQSENLGGEDIFIFSVDEPSWVRIVAEPDADADLVLNLRHGCESSNAIECRDGTRGGASETLSRFLPPGDYYLLVEGATPSSGGTYMVSVTAEPIVCDRGDATCLDASTSRFCNGQGIGFEEETCDTTCDDATGFCERLPGDACQSAFDASGGFVDTPDWDSLTNDYDPGPNGCVPDTFGTQTAGPDTAYFIELPPNHVLNATQTLGFGDRGSLYLVEDCLNLDSCVLGVNDNSGQIEELTYFNTSNTTETYWLIADMEEDAFGYQIGNVTILVEPTICTPGELRCMGTDIAETCQPLGTAWDSQFCSFGCNAGACAPVANNACTGAVDLIANGPITARIDEYGGTYNPGFSGCTQRSASGPDAVYSVTPAAGEVALVTVNADFDVSLYAATDCSDISQSCVAGADLVSQNDETIQFAGDGTTTYFVFVDSQFSGSGLYTISASLQQPTCTPGVPLQCLDSTTLQYCTELGIEAPYDCSTTCTNAACDSPIGQVCPDAIPLVDGQSYTGTIDTPNSINPGEGTAGACDFPSGAEPYGSDVIFRVDLLAGDWLFADYDINSSLAIAYLLDDCSDTDSCLVRSGEGGQESIVYEALTDQTVYLVLDRTTSSVSTLSYTVDIDIRRQDCAVGSPSFCSASDTIQYCDAFGFTREYVCDGNCTNGFCDTPRGDECIDPFRVQAGDTVTDDWSDGENNIEPVPTLDGWCEFDETTEPEGPEDVYAIDLLPGDLLKATLTTNYGSAYHYILEDCGDTSTCRDNNFDRGDGTVQYFSQFGGTVYVVVDASSTFNSTSDYTVRFDVSSGGLCAPNSTSCSANTLSRCDATGTGFETPTTCGAGCATPEACAPDVAADTCATAPLTGGTSVYASFDELTNDVEITSSGCTGSSGTGNDLVYAVTAGPGDVIHATMKSYGFESVQLYIAGDCTDPDGTCVAGERGDGSNFAEVYYAPTTLQTYYVVAESTSSFSDEPFALDVEVILPECVAGDFQCASAGGSMLVCNEFGLWETYPCSGGCMNDMCGDPVGQACFDAIPMGNGDTDSGTFDKPDNLDPGSGQVGGCSFSTSPNGADTIYSVDLVAGDVLNVDFTSTSSFGIAYILSDCSDSTSCIANTSDGTSGSLQYAATATETVYVIMDRTSSGSTTLSYTISFEVLQPNCTPGDPATCVDANTLEYCDAFGFSRQYTCGGATGTCTAGACDSPTADVCVDAGILSDGSQITGDFLGADDSSPGEGTHGACTFGPGDAPDGIDHFYEVSLAAGEWFVGNYQTSTTSAIAYLVATCGDISTCRAASAEGADGQVAYQATTDETLYFVMDRTTTGASAISWDLDVTIGPPTCTTGTTQCADSTTLQWCNQYGLFQDWTCNTTCTAGACDDASSEICADALPIADGAQITEDFGGTNTVDLGTGTVGSCDFGTEDQPGTDHFYRIDLQAGETATVDWTSSSSYAMFYFSSDCFAPSACLANSSAGNSGTLSYTATSAESVLLVVDRNLSGSTSSLDYTFDLTVN